MSWRCKVGWHRWVWVGRLIGAWQCQDCKDWLE
jgi:hypothetical protein